MGGGSSKAKPFGSIASAGKKRSDSPTQEADQRRSGVSESSLQKGRRGMFKLQSVVNLRRTARVTEGYGEITSPSGRKIRSPGSKRSGKLEAQLCTRYTKADQIWAALETGHVRLVRMSWLIDFATVKEGRKGPPRIPRRQDLPEAAFITVEELQDFYGQGSADNVLPIVAISYCWLTQGHPDPEGHQLKAVASKLSQNKQAYADFNFEDMGIFWDWMSMYQRDPTLWSTFMTRADEKLNKNQLAKKRRYENSRSAEQVDSIKWALSESMDLWYAHAGTSVFLLTEMPARFTRPTYDESGWTTYERCCTELVKENELDYANWRLVHELDTSGIPKNRRKSSHTMPRKGRRWPIGPHDFDVIIKNKAFTNGADCDSVSALYRRLSTELLGSTLMLDFESMPPPTEEDAARLGRCLNLCDHLETLKLNSVHMSDSASVALFSALSDNALPMVKELALNDNRIDDGGMQALADAFSRGALSRIRNQYTNPSDRSLDDKEAFNQLTSGINLAENPGSRSPISSVLGAPIF